MEAALIGGNVLDKWFEDIFASSLWSALQVMLRMSPSFDVEHNTDPLLSDGFKCRKSETLRATSEGTDICYGKEKTRHCVRIFTECHSFFPPLFFVNKVVLSQACRYELCWIEHERMLLAHHGNILAPSWSHRKSLVSFQQGEIKPRDYKLKFKQFLLYS